MYYINFVCIRWFIQFSFHVFLESRRMWPIYAFYFMSLLLPGKRYVWNRYCACDMISISSLDIKEILQINVKIQQRFWFALLYFLTLWVLDITRFSLNFFFQTSKCVTPIGFFEFSGQYPTGFYHVCSEQPQEAQTFKL